MRALAVSAPQRLAGLYAQTPTWVELSVDCVMGAWRGVTGARGLTEAQIAFWTRMLAAAVATGEWNTALASHYWTPAYVDGASLRQQLACERTEIEVVLRELGLLR